MLSLLFFHEDHYPYFIGWIRGLQLTFTIADFVFFFLIVICKSWLNLYVGSQSNPCSQKAWPGSGKAEPSWANFLPSRSSQCCGATGHKLRGPQSTTRVPRERDTGEVMRRLHRELWYQRRGLKPRVRFQQADVGRECVLGCLTPLSLSFLFGRIQILPPTFCLLLWGLSGIKPGKHLPQCLVHTRHWINEDNYFSIMLDNKAPVGGPLP